MESQTYYSEGNDKHMKIEQDDDFIYNSNNKKSGSKLAIAMSIGIAITLIIIIVVIIIMLGLKEKKLELYVDGKQVSFEENTFLFDEKTGNVYVSIRDIAPLVNYEAHNGEYKVDSEDPNKVYVESKDLRETASFFLNSKKISKVAPNSTDDYNNLDIKENVFENNGKLYVSTEGFMKGFNSVFSYNKEANNIVIQTLPYLVNYYSSNIANYVEGNYTGLSQEFVNQKALIYGMLVAINNNGKYGVINIENGKEILGARYNAITFIENSNEFIIKNSDKVGIAYSNGVNKIEVKYDEITVLDNNLGYYIVKSNSKYGVINSKDEFVVHIEYDKIGINSNNFQKDGAINKYLLCDKLIPVCINNKWGFFGIDGKKVIDTIYDDIGAINTGISDKVVDNTLIIKGKGVIVVKQENKYGGIDAEGRLIIPMLCDSIYSRTSGGKTEYYILWNNSEYSATGYIDRSREQQGITYEEKNEISSNNGQTSDNNSNDDENTTDNDENNINDNTTNNEQQEQNDETQEENNTQNQDENETENVEE